jgi:hypothetical protein
MDHIGIDVHKRESDLHPAISTSATARVIGLVLVMCPPMLLSGPMRHWSCRGSVAQSDARPIIPRHRRRRVVDALERRQT